MPNPSSIHRVFRRIVKRRKKGNLLSCGHTIAPTSAAVRQVCGVCTIENDARRRLFGNLRADFTETYMSQPLGDFNLFGKKRYTIYG